MRKIKWVPLRDKHSIKYKAISVNVFAAGDHMVTFRYLKFIESIFKKFA